MATTAVSHDSLHIPLIDFSQPTAPDTAAQILSGFQNAGFIYLHNHGIPSAQIKQAFAQSAQFFKRPEEQKLKLAWTTPEANRGYSPPGREKTTDAKNPEEIKAIREKEGVDLKESYEIGREGERGLPNHWPDFDAAGADFKTDMLAFHDRLKELHVQVMRSIAVGLGLEEGWFDGFTRKGDNTLRLLHYPEAKGSVFEQGAIRAGAHTDYGSCTLLFQDTAGGLQVLSPNGNYVDAQPIPDTIVVNAGDLLARWSNDSIKSTKHRVVEPPSKAEVHPARYSIAYFCNPDFDKFIEAIPGTWSKDKPKKYEGINSGEYLVQRLAATY